MKTSDDYLTNNSRTIIEKCRGCERVYGAYCKTYLYPEAKWRAGNCPLASHIKKPAEEKPVKKINPLKASKQNRT